MTTALSATQQHAVVSEPGNEIMGGGKNAKWVNSCTELYMGGRGIEKLRGFEPYVSLTSLWLNNNKLKKINNLEANFRIKALYAQENQICTLKGSLLTFKYLETLDLSNNLLRDLDKMVKTCLSKLKYLKSLNLMDNPCCEEPDYRLIVIYNIPTLQILDLHPVTAAERAKAKLVIGEEVKSLQVAFMGRLDPRPVNHSKSTLPSLEQSLAKEAVTIRDKRKAAQYLADTALFANDQYANPPQFYSANGMRTLPPNAGILGAFSKVNNTKKGDKGDNSAHHRRNSPSTTLRAAPLGLGVTSSPYVSKDVLVMFHQTPGNSPLQEQSKSFSGTSAPPVTGNESIKFEHEKYDEFLKQRTHGREKWQMRRTTVQV